MQLVTQQTTLRLKRQPTAAKVEPLQHVQRVMRDVGLMRGCGVKRWEGDGLKRVEPLLGGCLPLGRAKSKGVSACKVRYLMPVRKRYTAKGSNNMGEHPPVNRNSLFKVKRPVNLELPALHIKPHPAG